MKDMRNIRLDEMESMILKEGTISLKELSNTFEISLNTVRTDIEAITRRGRVKKVYGGVRAVMSDNELLDYRIREDKRIYIKQEICKKAADLVNDGDIIFIDSGTTTIHLTDYLKEKKNVKIVTNNIVVISKLLGNDNISVIGIGGVVRNKTMSFASSESLLLLKQYNIQKAFMAATAVNIKNGVMNSSFDERAVKMLAVEKAEQVYVLADSSKFDKSALLTYCDLDQLNLIITDGENKAYIDKLRKQGVNVLQI